MFQHLLKGDKTSELKTGVGTMFEFLKSKRFDYVFSFILGLGIMALMKPVCRGTECRVQKAPPLEEVTKTTYQYGAKCYQFKSEIAECKPSGVIEPFQQRLKF
jgi:hypothetical protein